MADRGGEADVRPHAGAGVAAAQAGEEKAGFPGVYWWEDSCGRPTRRCYNRGDMEPEAPETKGRQSVKHWMN